MYDRMIIAASVWLAFWAESDMRSVRVVDGRVDLLASPPEPGTFDIRSRAAAEALVASVFLGNRYRGWDDAVKACEKAA